MKKFYIRRDSTPKGVLVATWSTEEEIRLALAFGDIRYAEDSDGNPID